MAAREQPAEGVSLAPKIDVDDARVDWTRAGRRRRPPGAGVHPGAGRLDHVRGRAAEARVRSAPTTATRSRPGELAVGKSSVHVGTGSGRVRLGDVRPTGRKQMAAADWARGARLEPGATFA